MLRNDNGKFKDVSAEAGIHGSLISFGLGVTVGDINGDHYPDIYVSNDFFERDYLYVNQKNGSFKDELEESIQHVSHSSMGADIGDINNDGFPDIFTTDMLPYNDYRLKTTTSFESIDVNRLKVNSGFYHQYMQNTLQVNNGNGKFLETAYYSGVAASDWSWGGLIFDADNDGLSDIYVCNGIYNDVTDQDFIDFFANDVIQKMVMTGEKDEIEEVIKKMPSQPILNKAYKNRGDLKFSDEGPAWGFSEPSFSNGAAYGDLDNDGDLDLVINNVNQESFVYRNDSRDITKNNFIGFTLEGKGQNRFGIGAMVKLYQGNNIITRELIPSRGFQSSVDYKLTVGLGTKAVDSVTIIWPDTSITKLLRPQVNKVHHVVQTSNYFLRPDVTAAADPFFTRLPSVFKKHEEDDFVDFYIERGVPMMLSREGPKAAYGDVNGDGLKDLYICGAANQAGQLYLQTPAGFKLKDEDVFRHLASFEDVCAIFFDCDKDGDLDLFVGSGGNHHEVNNLSYQNRLYKNDGKGNFQVAINAFPNTGMNTSVAVANDFDNDGDLDLFVGSRSIPLSYGLIPENFLFINDGNGNFEDSGKERAAALARAGMVTTAVAADLDGDGRDELIVAGDWMPPRVFSFNNNAFTEVKTNLGDLHGWWKTVISSDVDADGDQDLLLGNIGENFYLQPDASSPVKMFISDFDQNGTIEKIITRSIGGKDMPVFLKKELTDQIVSLRKQNLKYSEFANKSINELFPPEILRNAEVRTFNYPSSCLAINQGQGNFEIRKLPVMVQLSSVNAALATDVNDDGSPDLILAGNQFDFLPQFSRLDASFGHLLLNNGKGTFTWIAPAISGLDIKHQVRDIIEVQGSRSTTILMLQNNDYPVLYNLQHKKQLR